MSIKYEEIREKILHEPKQWLVTGVAGFIGSNLLETLLKLNQTVVGLDNFSTGHKNNLEEVKSVVNLKQWSNFKFVEGDIRNLDVCQKVCKNIDYVLHEAAIGSVPRSINDPIFTNDNNINGMLNMLVAARDNKVQRFVYAASSSTYGDHPGLPKIEDRIGKPLSPYAITKYVNELYADVFARCYGIECIGLRYFNVFGKRQDPNGAYAAVIPKWINAMINGDLVKINGDGSTSRDFCYVTNVMQANILAATSDRNAANNVYNVAYNASTSLNELFELLRSRLDDTFSHLKGFKPLYGDFREGDIMHSRADISKAETLLGYKPTHNISKGLDEALNWYKNKVKE